MLNTTCFGCGQTGRQSETAMEATVVDPEFLKEGSNIIDAGALHSRNFDNAQGPRPLQSVVLQHNQQSKNLCLVEKSALLGTYM